MSFRGLSVRVFGSVIRTLITLFHFWTGPTKTLLTLLYLGVWGHAQLFGGLRRWRSLRSIRSITPSIRGSVPVNLPVGRMKGILAVLPLALGTVVTP